jgi:CelD/BcsL family acetyltransferase involved in cellulose biosynthesis
VRDQGYTVHISREAGALPEMVGRLGVGVANTPFQSCAWLAQLYKSFCGPTATPLIVSIDDEQGPLLVLPLCVRRKLGVGVLEFADFGVCDYNAPILGLGRPIDPRAVADAVGQLRLALPEVDLLRWRKMPTLILGHVNPLTLLPGTFEMDVGAWAVKLPRSLSEYEMNSLSKSFRKELQKKLRRTASRGIVVHRAASCQQERVDLFERLFEQRQARCEEMGRYHLMSHPRVKSFYRSILLDPACATMTNISAIDIDGEPLATMFSLYHEGTNFVLMTTFESGAWKSCSLGNVIIHHGVARSIEQGATAFDLTIGDESYKSDFGASRSHLLSFRKPFTTKGRVLAYGADVFGRYRPSEASTFGRTLRSFVAAHGGS